MKRLVTLNDKFRRALVFLFTATLTLTMTVIAGYGNILPEEVQDKVTPTAEAQTGTIRLKIVTGDLRRGFRPSIGEILNLDIGNSFTDPENWDTGPKGGPVGEGAGTRLPQGMRFKYVPKVWYQYPTEQEMVNATRVATVGADGFAYLDVPRDFNGGWIIPDNHTQPANRQAHIALTNARNDGNGAFVGIRYGWHTGHLDRNNAPESVRTVPRTTDNLSANGDLPQVRFHTSGLATWPRKNPPLLKQQQSCAPPGYNVRLVMDVSNSLTQKGYFTTYKNQLKRFVNALADPKYSGIYLDAITFASTSPAHPPNPRLGFPVNLSANPNGDTPVYRMGSQTSANALNSRIDGMTIAGQRGVMELFGTNWDEALYQARAKKYTADGSQRSSRWNQGDKDADLVLFLTDGMPTVDMGAPGFSRRITFDNPISPWLGQVTRDSVSITNQIGETKYRNVEMAAMSANSLKSDGTRVVALGVGAGASSDAAAENLRAITGWDKGDDFHQTNDWTSIARTLESVLPEPCPPELDIKKEAAANYTPLMDGSGKVTGRYTVTLTNDGAVPSPVGDISEIPTTNGAQILAVRVNGVDRTNVRNSRGNVQLVNPNTQIPAATYYGNGQYTPGKLVYTVEVDYRFTNPDAVVFGSTRVCNNVQPHWQAGWDPSGSYDNGACEEVQSVPSILDIEKKADDTSVKLNSDGTATVNYTVTVRNQGRTSQTLNNVYDTTTARVDGSSITKLTINGMDRTSAYQNGNRVLLDNPTTSIAAGATKTYRIAATVKYNMDKLYDGSIPSSELTRGVCNTVNPADWESGWDPSGTANNTACVPVTYDKPLLDLEKVANTDIITLDDDGNGTASWTIKISNPSAAPANVGIMGDFLKLPKGAENMGEFTSLVVNGRELNELWNSIDGEPGNKSTPLNQTEILGDQIIDPGETLELEAVAKFRLNRGNLVRGDITEEMLSQGVCNTVSHGWMPGWDPSGTANNTACIPIAYNKPILDFEKVANTESIALDANGNGTASWTIRVTNPSEAPASIGMLIDRMTFPEGMESTGQITDVTFNGAVPEMLYDNPDDGGKYFTEMFETSLVPPGATEEYEVVAKFTVDREAIADGRVTPEMMQKGVCNLVGGDWPSNWDPSGEENNTACIPFTVSFNPSLSVTKFINGEDANNKLTAVTLSQEDVQMIVRVVVENTGDVALGGFNITDVVSSGSDDPEYVQKALRDAGMTVDGNPVDTLEPGQSGVYEVVVDAPAEGDIHTNDVTVTATPVGGGDSVEDTDPANAFKMPSGFGLPHTGNGAIVWLLGGSLFIALSAIAMLKFSRREN